MSSGLNTTTGEISIALPSIGGMSQQEFIGYSVSNAVMFLLIIALLCVYRMDYFHVINEKRLEKEIEKADR